MNDKLRRLLLFSIRSNKDLNTLVQVGFNYADIISCFTDLIDQHLVILEKQKYCLSKKGQRELNNLLTEYKDHWNIEPLNSYKIAKIPLEDIYLP